MAEDSIIKKTFNSLGRSVKENTLETFSHLRENVQENVEARAKKRVKNKLVAEKIDYAFLGCKQKKKRPWVGNLIFSAIYAKFPNLLHFDNLSLPPSSIFSALFVLPKRHPHCHPMNPWGKFVLRAGKSSPVMWWIKNGQIDLMSVMFATRTWRVLRSPVIHNPDPQTSNFPQELWTCGDKRVSGWYSVFIIKEDTPHKISTCPCLYYDWFTSEILLLGSFFVIFSLFQGSLCCFVYFKRVRKFAGLIVRLLEKYEFDNEPFG